MLYFEWTSATIRTSHSLRCTSSRTLGYRFRYPPPPLSLDTDCVRPIMRLSRSILHRDDAPGSARVAIFGNLGQPQALRREPCCMIYDSFIMSPSGECELQLYYYLDLVQPPRLCCSWMTRGTRTAYMTIRLRRSRITSDSGRKRPSARFQGEEDGLVRTPPHSTRVS